MRIIRKAKKHNGTRDKFLEQIDAPSLYETSPWYIDSCLIGASSRSDPCDPSILCIATWSKRDMTLNTIFLSRGATEGFAPLVRIEFGRDVGVVLLDGSEGGEGEVVEILPCLRAGFGEGHDLGF